MPWRAALCLLLALLSPLEPAGAQEVRVWRVGPFDFLRGPLPPVAPGVLDGLGTAAVCEPPAAPLDRALHDALTGHGAALSCGNAFVGLLSFPADDAGISGQPDTPLGPFEAIGDLIRGARREVLLANMIWDDGERAPGAVLARAVADLRADLRDHPERHPGGVTVRVLLGNSVRLDRLTDPTASLYSAARHLREAGVPLSGDPVPGWRLEVANYAYAYPHNHMKLLVVDGQDVLSGGYNVSWFHVPDSEPPGLGLSDLALHVRGPVARHAVAAFRDAWQHARPLVCARAPTADTLRADCPLGETTAPYPLVWPGPAEVAGPSRVYGLYRRAGEDGGDRALIALLGAARGTVDLLQSQVSGTLRCDLSLLTPGACPFPQEHLPVWQALIGAVVQRGVRVRMVLDYDPLLRVETLSFLGGVWAYLTPLGLADHVQARWSGEAGGLHTKAALIDDAMLEVGSPNLQFASFGPGGLSEYALATSDPQALALGRRLFDFEWNRSQPLELPAQLRPAR